ncbi:hypothetical protein QTP70_032303 [Hemibagrus guttatus]|uniref:Reverse transcriptase domain-containing protein n=1 Tax=Hemibagrus guttatus TaxID=175788 RepID=A0AAE0RLE3_9TELE|nr:hypothetical protein QTP70_032303 [Hemibagrus guttatus]
MVSKMKLLTLVLLLSSFSSLTLTEVVNSFKQSCPNFFIRNPEKPSDIIIPTIFSGHQYKMICQRWKNKYRFATVYDTVRRIPVYSAYTLLQAGETNRDEWKIEPQLEDIEEYKDLKNMMDSPSEAESIFNQAVDSDYKDTGYTRGHVFPLLTNLLILVAHENSRSDDKFSLWASDEEDLAISLTTSVRVSEEKVKSRSTRAKSFILTHGEGVCDEECARNSSQAASIGSKEAWRSPSRTIERSQEGRCGLQESLSHLALHGGNLCAMRDRSPPKFHGQGSCLVLLPSLKGGFPLKESHDKDMPYKWDPRHFLQLFRRDPAAFPGQLRDMVSSACPVSSPGSLPGGACCPETSRRHPKQMPEKYQLSPFDVEEQRLYSEVLPGDRAPYPISNGAPRHPTEEAHFGRLYPGSYPFGHDPELMTIDYRRKPEEIAKRGPGAEVEALESAEGTREGTHLSDGPMDKASWKALSFDTIAAIQQAVRKIRAELFTSQGTNTPLDGLYILYTTHSGIKIIDISSAFNTIIPQHLIEKLSLLGTNTSLCYWILDFLTGRSQSVRIENSISSTTTLNTGAPQGCLLSPLLFTLLTHDCASMHNSIHIIMFTNDTAVVGLIRKNNESAYREEVQRLTAWCKANNLSLNVEKMKEMVVDFRRTQSDHSPLNINRSNVEIIKSTKFLGVRLAEDLTWSLNTSSITKKAQQRLYFLRRLRKAHLPPLILTTFYRAS